MSVIKQISVFDGNNWSTGDIGADASNIDISSAILGSSTNVQSALTTIGNKIGTTAIPSGLGTTITGAINTLNTKLDPLYKTYYTETSGNFFNWLDSQTWNNQNGVFYIIINTANTTGLPETNVNTPYCIFMKRWDNSQIFFINNYGGMIRIWKNYKSGNWQGWKMMNIDQGIQPITLTANSQTEYQIVFPHQYPSNNISISCTVQFYSAASMVSAPLIRSIDKSSFWVRIYFSGSTTANVKLHWYAKYHGTVAS